MLCASCLQTVHKFRCVVVSVAAKPRLAPTTLPRFSLFHEQHRRFIILRVDSSLCAEDVMMVHVAKRRVRVVEVAGKGRGHIESNKKPDIQI